MAFSRERGRKSLCKTPCDCPSGPSFTFLQVSVAPLGLDAVRQDRQTRECRTSRRGTGEGTGIQTRERERENERRERLFSVHLFVALVQVAYERVHGRAPFTCSPSRRLIRHPAFIGDRQPLFASESARDYLYRSLWRAASFQVPALIFDYYRLCAISRRFLDVSARGDRRPSHNLPSLFFLFLSWQLVLPSAETRYYLDGIIVVS